jgi:toxin ParE1/3/4
LKRVVYSDLALQDQEETADFNAERQGPDLAIRYLQASRRVLSLLAEKPHLGIAHRFRDLELHGVQWFPLTPPFQKHLLFCRAEREYIEVIRVLHASRDIEAILEGDS